MTAISRHPLDSTRKARRMTSARREALYGYAFALPWILGFLLWVGGPVIASLFFSFCEYDVASAPSFIGLKNYIHALTADNLFWSSLGRTFYYVALTVPVGILGSLVVASALNQHLPGTLMLRSLYYLPCLTPMVALTVLWKWILHPRLGILNYVLESVFHIEGPGWLGTTEWAIPSLAIMALWGGIGGNRMLIFLAGLQGVPQPLYDAAKIDGANRWHTFRHVTLPMISPTIFFNLVLGTIGALKVFASAFVATRGGPAYATWFFALHIYTNAFEYFQMGYSSALAWIFLIVLLAFTLVQFRASRQWVYYAGEVE